MKALKEQRCEREPSVDVDDDDDDDDFAGLACPLDDLEAVVILESETTTFDPSNLFHDVKLDDHDMAIQEMPKKPPSHGKGKNLETLRLVLCAPPPSSCQQNPTGPTKSDAHHQWQDWDDEEKLENSKRKLHDQGYQEFQNKRKKIQLLDVKNLPLPSKPQRGRVLSENKPLISSRKCPEPSDFSKSQQNPKELTKSTDHDLPHRQDWDDEEKLETSVRKLHQGYQEFQNKRKKIQVIDIKNLPLPSKPGRGRVLTKNKFLTSSRKCRAF